MQLISKYNKSLPFLLCIIDISTKNAWVVSLKYKKGITITNVFYQSLMNLDTQQTKYGWIDVVSFTIDQWNHGYKIMI